MLDASQISRRIKLRQLNVFIAVVEYGSMAKAAEHLAISQPVISKMIASLEQTLGLQLLERSRAGIEPTLYGKALLKRSIALCNDLRSSVVELQSLADPTMGELRIGSTEPVMAGLLPTIINRLSQQYPRLAVRIIEGEPPELLDRHLRNHDIDLMIGRVPTPTPAADTDVEVLLHESGVVVAGLNNLWARRRKIRLAELINERWCLPPRESFPGGWIAAAFHASGLEVPRASVTVYSILMQTALLTSERFLSFLPASMLHFSAKRLSLKVLPVEMPARMWPIGIITIKGRTPNPAQRLFVECTREIATPLARKRTP
ncbi:LysR family transcriptional regulator [Bradyrhizobium sp. 139]|uniref:LysR family transcriptional regulator n=1 Tax=Bradyrhizobium sp. 139 TaxID=2782616 RepID=UPI001FF923A9|nr:LysR family transcriptional regulator [Bradyrhizobium sp. 139]MCK1739821.1 LysR family transcriptional regulator [Bradyrhizobium sp. 139]